MKSSHADSHMNTSTFERLTLSPSSGEQEINPYSPQDGDGVSLRKINVFKLFDTVVSPRRFH
jgi:hypothetical protein